MDAARVELVREIAKARHGDRLRVYVPLTAGGDPIYVHSKTAIVDDRLIRVGSANLNNRSMGLDSECDVTIDAALSANRGVEPTIRKLRSEEHTSELQSLMRISYAVFCLKKKKPQRYN